MCPFGRRASTVEGGRWSICSNSNRDEPERIYYCCKGLRTGGGVGGEDLPLLQRGRGTWRIQMRSQEGKINHGREWKRGRARLIIQNDSHTSWNQITIFLMQRIKFLSLVFRDINKPWCWWVGVLNTGSYEPGVKTLKKSHLTRLFWFFFSLRIKPRALIQSMRVQSRRRLDVLIWALCGC